MCGSCHCVSGRIEVFAGPMCAAKTQKLIQRLTRAQIAGLPVFVFKPFRGRQKNENYIISRQGSRMEAITLQKDSALEVLELIENQGERCAVGFDESQWIMDLKEACSRLANKGHLVYVAGLDMDYRGEPFLEMCKVMGVAEVVEKTTAVSVECGCSATHTSRLGDGVDAGGEWEPRCRRRWFKHICDSSSS